MDDRNDRIESKVDKVIDEISSINVHIAEIKADLKYHIKRTDLLEHKVVPLWLGYKILGGVGLLLTLGACVVEILGYFKNGK